MGAPRADFGGPVPTVELPPVAAIPPVAIPPVPTAVELVVPPDELLPPESLPPDCAAVAPPELVPSEVPPVAVTYMTVGTFDRTFSVFSPQPDPSQVVTNVPHKPKIQIRPPRGYCSEAIGGDIVGLRLKTISKSFLAL